MAPDKIEMNLTPGPLKGSFVWSFKFPISVFQSAPIRLIRRFPRGGFGSRGNKNWEVAARWYGGKIISGQFPVQLQCVPAIRVTLKVAHTGAESGFFSIANPTYIPRLSAEPS